MNYKEHVVPYKMAGSNSLQFSVYMLTVMLSKPEQRISFHRCLFLVKTKYEIIDKFPKSSKVSDLNNPETI